MKKAKGISGLEIRWTRCLGLVKLRSRKLMTAKFQIQNLIEQSQTRTVHRVRGKRWNYPAAHADLIGPKMTVSS